MMSGIELIAYERLRQFEAEGFSTKHDDAHMNSQLLSAAMCYAGVERLLAIGAPISRDQPPLEWPWSLDDWKPTDDPIRNLVKAGALIAAEIDRLQRLTNSKGG
jgi:hypothetical protein